MIDTNGPEPDWYYLTDGLGSVMAIVNTAGTVRRYVYEPYGEQLRNFIDANAASPNQDLDGIGSDPKDTEADFNPYRYASGYYDRATGLLKFGTRYYLPTLARWTQVDPQEGQPNNPPTLNAYVYVEGDPVNFTDLTGRDFGDWLGGLAGALGGAAAGWMGATLIQDGLLGWATASEALALGELSVAGLGIATGAMIFVGALTIVGLTVYAVTKD
jgi:RHS repeat-associated protein